MGSVKDLQIIETPSKRHPGIGRFIFSDRYSVFDWGEMPDHITDKGKSLCLIGAYFFEKLAEIGIKTHYIGVVENGEPKSLKDLKKATNCMEFHLLRVLHPRKNDDSYDYSIYESEKYNYLVPLEVIYRNYIVEGSSLLKRLQKGDIQPQEIGLKKIPIPGERLREPIIETSTKLESSDRYIYWNEAIEIAGLAEDGRDAIRRTTQKVSTIIDKECQSIGLVNVDGKLEFGVDHLGNIIVVDVLGTPDECRFTFKGIPMSKEIARIHYRKTPWYEEVKNAKIRDRLNWKNFVKSNPPELPRRVLELISQLYKSIACEITQRRWFEDTPSLRELVKEIRISLGDIKVR